jgi:molybdate transport system substrate-binding protein
MRGIVDALLPEFEKRTGHKVSVDNATAGALAKRIAGGEAFDVAIITPKVLADLTQKGKIAAGSRTDLAKVGMGVAVKAGAALPDIATVEAFKRTLLAAKSVAYIDPKAGGSSGIYFDGLLARLGIADAVRPKAKLKQGGYVADLVASGEAEIGVHQISEIVPVKGVVLVGPLPAEVQNYTTYSAAVGPAARDAAAAKALIGHLAGPAAATVLKARGMERP